MTEEYRRSHDQEQVAEALRRKRHAGEDGSSQPFNGYDRILFSKTDGDEASIWSMGVDGRGLRQITAKVTGFYDYFPIWEPTERKLVIYNHYENESGRYDIRTVNTETGVVVELTTGYNEVVGGGAFHGVYSPDGTKIACVKADDGGGAALVVMNTDGSAKTEIVVNDDYHGANISSDHLPSWSPDGSRIAFGITDSATPGDNGLWICDADDGENPTQVIDEATAGGKVVSVAWSRHDVLAYTVNASPYELHTINPDGSDDAQIGDIEGYYVNWSPDGTRLAVTTNLGKNIIVELDGTVSQLPDSDTYAIHWGQNGDKPGWSSIAPVAAFVANGSTVDQLRDSLIAAGLVAPS